MEINFSIRDYFNELKIIKEIYPQEIAIYPWIFMILQMAECKRREALGDNYKPVSIIDMHDATDNYRKLKGEGGFPDFQLFNKESIIGCVEIKKCFDLKNKKIKNVFIKKPKKRYNLGRLDQEYILQYGEKHKSRTTYTNIVKLNEDIELKTDIIGLNKDELLKKIKTVLNKEINDEIEKLNKEIEKIKNKNKYIEYFCLRKTSQYKWQSNISNDLNIGNLLELRGHLKSFKKVLLTNGLEFYFLKLEEKEIKVKCIADLKESYENYSKANDQGKEEVIKGARCEWKKLIDSLAGINWAE